MTWNKIVFFPINRLKYYWGKYKFVGIIMLCHRIINFPINRLRRYWNRKKIRKYVPNSANLYPTVICNNCTGGFILHDLQMPFNSPFINICLSDEDYLKILENLQGYMEMELSDDTKENRYPIGLLGDIRIHFMHYDTFEQAKEAWQRRRKRMNYDNIVVIASCVNTEAENLGERFNNLQYKHKILLHNDKTIEVPYSVYLKGYPKGTTISLAGYQGLVGKRGYDQVDWVDFFIKVLSK